MKFSTKEKKLISLLKKQKLSPSHQLDHLLKVAQYAKDLSRIYDADQQVVVAAALLHDLGRSDSRNRGKNSAIIGAKLAAPILRKTGYSTNETKTILQAIAEHDQPKFRSKLLESRILKDADYLDGFGARSIVRSIMYAGETGGGANEAIQRMINKGRARLNGLEFEESRRLGWKLHRLTELLVTNLNQTNKIIDFNYQGKYVVLEGISGSGKDTQAKLLQKNLKKLNIKSIIVNHPTDHLKSIWKLWRHEVNDLESELFLMVADRLRMVKSTILPALKKGEWVISTRSSVSAQVYQATTDELASLARFLFSFDPVYDLIIFLDITPKVALGRVDKRIIKGKEKDRGFFGVTQATQRKRFTSILKNYPYVKKIDASGTKLEVGDGILSLIKNKFL
jgi:dTMP kinase